METKIYASDLQELVIEVDHGKSPYTTNHYLEREFRTEDLIGAGSYKEIFLDGIFIGYGDMELSRMTSIYIESEAETVEMHFALDGYSRANSKSLDHERGFKPNQHNVFYTHYFKGAIEYSSEKSMKVFEVNMSTDFIKKYLPSGHLFDQFREKLEKHQSTVLLKENYPITPRMMSLIQGIIYCNRTREFKRMFLESSVIELLMNQLEQISKNDSYITLSVNRKQKEQLYAARDILKNELKANFTINSLAQQVGTNEFTLKKGFKELFGTTVFGFWNQLKMEEAKTQLVEGRLNVAEVSFNIGYKNPHHFSVAFKRYFGYSPSVLK
ncbi:MAG: AraC family transcriptional regulator [Bacteroidota bacterium]